MRADAARNVDAVLQTGARLLAEDPTASIAAIAAAAGVDRRTVYRRFASRDALIAAVFDAKIAEIDEVIGDCRLFEAPVAVALHRLVEGAVAVRRRYPLELEQVGSPEDVEARVLAQRERVESFLRRGIEEGAFRSDLPDGLTTALLEGIIGLMAGQFRDLDCGRAADIVVDIALNGIGSG